MSSRTNPFVSIATPSELEALLAWAGHFTGLTLDLGAGDGRFARTLAQASPERAVVAIDTCGANARSELRRAPANLRFVVADARVLPEPLSAAASEIVINFPWGSLLDELLNPTHELVASIADRPLVARVNGGALAEAGFDFEHGSRRLLESFRHAGTEAQARILNQADLRTIPCTWAKRLAFGRDPRAIELRSNPAARSLAAD